MRTLLLAWRYIVFHKMKTMILIVSITLTAYLPVLTPILLARILQRLTARAATTPLVIGAKGSRFDLVLHALYFETEPPGTISMLEVAKIRNDKDKLAVPIPLYVRHQARRAPVVGTSLDYFRFRNLHLTEGQQLTRLGDCVLGANVARRLGLHPGDYLMSDPENVFDIAGTYPLKMRITGVLAKSRSADDDAVFVDVKTAWVIDGLAHGHQDLARSSDESVVLRRDDDKVVANAALMQFTEITDDNIRSFHFHGDPAEFPISAIIVLPDSRKSEVILIGRYHVQTSQTQILTPSAVVQEMMDMVFKVKRFFDANAALVALATSLLLALVIVLSVRLRRREMQTMFRLGCSRLTVVRLLAAELLIILVACTVITTVLVALTMVFAPYILRAVMVGG
jgi:putative ABC transport system permease protein